MAEDSLIHWSDDGQLLGYGESDSTGAWLKIRVLPEDLEKFRGLKGAVFYWTAVQLANDGQPIPVTKEYKKAYDAGMAALDRSKTLTKPYGHEAGELYKSGFFLNPAIHTKIGTDQEFRDWLESQPCPVKTQKHEGDVVAAHVRRIANGAGTAIKPEYSAIPLCHLHHHQQHHLGETAIGGKEWMDKQRNHHVVDWASHKLARDVFGEVSMGYVAPHRFMEWAISQGVEQWLPAVYRK